MQRIIKPEGLLEKLRAAEKQGYAEGLAQGFIDGSRAGQREGEKMGIEKGRLEAFQQLANSQPAGGQQSELPKHLQMSEGRKVT